ncbi:hypothetical protein DEU56DRAFT_782465 [Suillus clintonianus]|uniref:uncharacterized protein n=1 Tax=Suillus clintonianus TaxID=1904413 RepID=UPI001B863448|nr:uncharacterized protein DEU56DRAFT_782465 [Suillus clintonianus]KAG2148833.1 hypothetical protein DEU56DRAFT_782465 [Suillus clintonianus]
MGHHASVIWRLLAHSAGQPRIVIFIGIFCRTPMWSTLSAPLLWISSAGIYLHKKHGVPVLSESLRAHPFLVSVSTNIIGPRVIPLLILIVLT